MKRAARHPAIYAALAAEEISESCAETVCSWTDKLPADRSEAEAAVLRPAEARLGAGLRDLAELAAEILARFTPAGPDQDPDDGGSMTGR